MKTKTMIITGIAITALAAVPLLYAAGNRSGLGGCAFGRGHGGGLMKMHRFKEELNLTDAQMSALHEIARKTREQNVEAHRALKSGFAEAAQVLLADPSNIDGARVVLDRNRDTVDQLKTSVLAGVSEGLKVLTPEQRQKLGVLIQEHLAGEAARQR